MTPFGKFWTALLFAVVTAAAGVLPSSGHFTEATAVNLAIAVVGAVAVYVGPNVPGVPGWLSGAYTKVILAGLSAALMALASFISAGGHLGSIPPAEWWQVLAAVLNAVGVFAVPNQPAARKAAA